MRNNDAMRIKLLCTPASPFSRKVMVVAHEAGVAQWVEQVTVDVMASPPDPILAAANPLMKVPAIILENGTSLYDSALIADYFAWLGEDQHLFPATVPESWHALRRQALADGIVEAAILMLIEKRRRPDTFRWQGWINHQAVKLRQGLDALEQDADTLEAEPRIGEIATGCLLAFLDMDMSEELWRDTRPNLSRWYETFALRPSMVATRPPPV